MRKLRGLAFVSISFLVALSFFGVEQLVSSASPSPSAVTWAKDLWECQLPGPRSVVPSSQKMDVIGYFKTGIKTNEQRVIALFVGTNLGRCIGEVVLDSIGGQPVLVVTATKGQVRTYQPFVADLLGGTSGFLKVTRGGSCSRCKINPFVITGS
jgi:hypothetical protein